LDSSSYKATTPKPALAFAPPDLRQFVFSDFSAKRIPVDAENLRRAGLIAVQPFQNALDEFLLELSHSFFEQNSAIDHHADQRFQLIFHVLAPDYSQDDRKRRAI